MKALQKLNRDMKLKLFKKKILGTINDDKLIRYIEKCGNLEIKMLKLAFEQEISTKVITKMIEIGGHQLVMEKDKKGGTALYYACLHKASTPLIMKIIEIGGRPLVMEKDQYGFNAFRDACRYKASTRAIMKMIDFGGNQLVMEKNSYYGYNILHIVCQLK